MLPRKPGIRPEVIDWREAFAPQTPILEIITRGSAVYLALYLMLRVVMKRETGTTGMSDLLVIVLIADAAQNAMAGGYASVADGLVLVATIVTWAYLLDFLAYRFPRLRRLIQPRPLLLVKDGNLLRRNLRRELITEEELRSQLRQHGIEELRQVRRLYMEPDGQFSVVTGSVDQPGRHRRRRY